MKNFDDFLNESYGNEAKLNAAQIADLQKHVDAANKAYSDKFVAASTKAHIKYEYVLQVKPGQKYARIVQQKISVEDGSVTSSTAWGFAGADGRVYKASGWNTPSKNFARGSWQDIETIGAGKWRYGVE